MGYNSRALRLRDAARVIVEKYLKAESCQLSAFSGFPCDLADLYAIPGVGPYTAAAIRNFAFNIPTPCIDTNIRRILHRTFVGPESADGTWAKDDGYLLKIAGNVLDAALGTEKLSAFSFQLSASGILQDAANWHAALMDFGSLIQTKRNPQWDMCPLTSAGIMKTTPAQFVALQRKAESRKLQATSLSMEPGRFVGTRYIPNRIFRGKIIEELRDAPKGLPLEKIGRSICLDWSPREHRKWLKDIIQKLRKDNLLSEKKGRFSLMD
jgi:A/G-specific adenine glycosylase